MIKIRRRKVNIPVSSMSDIAFLLLIFLMVTTLTSSQKAVTVTLPQVVKASKIDAKKRINVYIKKDGKLFYNSKQVDTDKLMDILENLAVFNKHATVFLYSDVDTEYRHVDSVIQILKNVQIRNCVFATKNVTSQVNNAK
ncbi:MAG: biopolymer transporter ExbD [Elusimicrobiota bacterium]